MVGQLVEAEWIWPEHLHGRSSRLAEAFSAVREESSSNAENFKAQAGDVMMLCPLLLLFVNTELVKHTCMAQEVASFQKIIVLTQHIISSKRGDLCPQPVWEKAWAEHQEAYQLAYGRAAVKPKGHSAFHLGWQWKRDKAYFDCFCGERQNATSKNCIQVVDNTRTDERTSLARMLNAKIRLLMEPNALRGGILPPHAVDAEVAIHFGVAHCLLGAR